MIVAVVASSAEETELKQFVQEHLPAWQVPRRWRFVESLAAGPRGKNFPARIGAQFRRLNLK